MNLINKILKENEEENLFQPRRVEERQSNELSFWNKKYPIGSKVPTLMWSGKKLIAEITSEFRYSISNQHQIIADCKITIPNNKVKIGQQYGILNTQILVFTEDEGYIEQWIYDKDPEWLQTYTRKK